MKSIAIITARGGSKRIPRKNIKPFHGKPIISYSIDAALSSGVFDEVMVSTDDEEIAKIALELGAKVPFMRSDKNSDDYSTTADVVLEVLNDYKKQGEEFDYVCCLYPTAPFVTSEVIKATFSKLKDNSEAQGLVPVVSFGFPIQRALQVDDDGFFSSVWPEYSLTRSQDLEKRFHDVGQFYWLKYSDFLEQKKMYMNKMLSYEVEELQVQDIDNEIDWKLAELKYSLIK